MLKNTFITCLAAALLIACSGKKPEAADTAVQEELTEKPERLHVRVHKDLLWSKTEYMGDANSGDFFNLADLNNKVYTNQTQYEDYLLVTSYFNKNNCATYKGNIKTGHDTIVLTLEPATTANCPGIAFYRVTYLINASSPRPFVFVKENTRVD